jgi:hypothetical protein
LTKKEIEEVINCHPGSIEEVLKKVYIRLNQYSAGETKKRNNNNSMAQEKENPSGSKVVPSEQNYKELLLQKDMIIHELKSTLEVNL